MRIQKENWALVLGDTSAIIVAWWCYYLFRVKSGLVIVPLVPDFLAPMIVVLVFWLVTFFLVGLYRPFHAGSRFDEVALIFKSVSMGCLFLFVAVFVDDTAGVPGASSRLLIVVYWAILLTMVTLTRMVLRSIQRRLLIAGVGAHNTIIIGTAARARQLYDEVRKYPALGLRIVGFVTPGRRSVPGGQSTVGGAKILGNLNDLPRIIPQRHIRDALIAQESSDHEQLLEIVNRLGAFNIGIKIVPDLYDIISGMAKTNQIYGFPLIDISPQLMKPWEAGTKRVLDIGFAGTVLIAGLPLWIIIALAIKLDSRGPVLYKQKRVGKDGGDFWIVKFRSMRHDAEKEGPRWAHKRDPRVTRVGRLLRSLHLDEFPQLWNVLKGEMSLVGPRPERPVFVDQLTKEIPMYPRRLRVRPGVTGWAQVKHKYDESIDDVRKKVRYDLYYIENMSLRMDFKILANTVSHVLLGRGH